MSQAEYQSREVAGRVLAAEFNDVTYTFKESDDDRAPTYGLLPTGEKANRIFFVGTLTETDDVGEDSEYWQGRIAGPTGTFVVYAGQYQPGPAAKLRDLDTPAYVAVVGKPRTYETDDGSILTSVRPESITVVDNTTRNQWVADAAEKTLDRIKSFDNESNEYVRMAKEQYGGDLSSYRDAVVTALESLDIEDSAGSDPSSEPTVDAEAAEANADLESTETESGGTANQTETPATSP